MKDLFGNEITLAEAERIVKRKEPQANGYVARPGSGPKGETCKTCQHLVRIQYSKRYLKCELARARWTRGPGSDIRAKAPACEKWQKREGKVREFDTYYGGER